MSLRLYSQYVDPYLLEAPREELDEETQAKIRDYSVRIEDRKLHKNPESVRKTDPKNMGKRELTGKTGEAAVFQFLGLGEPDYRVGNTKDFVGADIECLGCGIKSFFYEYNKFPTLERYPQRPEIICAVLSLSEVAILGVASIKVQLDHQDDDLIFTKAMLKRKTGFYGFDKLLKFQSYAELVGVLAELKKECVQSKLIEKIAVSQLA